MAAAQNMVHAQTIGKGGNAPSRTAQVTLEGQEGALTVPLFSDDKREYAVVLIDGVRYHLERLTPEELVAEYKVDGDPDYAPQADHTGYCYFMVPFSR